MVKETVTQDKLCDALKKLGLTPEEGMWVSADYGKDVEVDILLKHEMILVETWAHFFRHRKKQKNIPLAARQEKDKMKTQFFLKNNFVVLWIEEKEMKTDLQIWHWALLIKSLVQTRMSTTDLPNPLKYKWYFRSDNP